MVVVDRKLVFDAHSTMMVISGQTVVGCDGNSTATSEYCNYYTTAASATSTTTVLLCFVFISNSLTL